MSTALGYLDQTRHRLNLTIRADCHVQKILFEGNRAVGAMVESGGEIFTVEGNEIILSSGAIGSPHILMLSGVGPAAHLQEFGIPVVADLPGVGQNMRDHPLVWVTWRTKPEIPLDGLAPPDAGDAAVHCRRLAPAQRHEDVHAVLRHRAHQPGRRPHGAGGHPPDQRHPAWRRARASCVCNPPTRRSSPSSTTATWKTPSTWSGCGRRCASASSLGESDAFKDIIQERIEPTDAELETDESLDGYLFREVTTSQHISCTAKMGSADDPMAVVSQYGKVHGLEGLRVADASIMPDCIRANTNVTTMMIGERVAEFIKAGK